MVVAVVAVVVVVVVVRVWCRWVAGVVGEEGVVWRCARRSAHVGAERRVATDRAATVRCTSWSWRHATLLIG